MTVRREVWLICQGAVLGRRTLPKRYRAAVQRALEQMGESPHLRYERRAERILAALVEHIASPRAAGVPEVLRRHELHISPATFHRLRREFLRYLAKALKL